MIEQNWSGRGQHTEFRRDEQKLINDILQVQDTLGSTRTAIVQSVNCRRILLARKTITCGKHTMRKEEVLKEVSHLTRLKHAHILRLIGTYVRGRELSILLYPVADYNLEGFLEAFRARNSLSAKLTDNLIDDMEYSINGFYACLGSAVAYIHQHLTKHMDIKPQNILIRKQAYDHRGHNRSRVLFKAYVADFGIARAYEKLEETETDGCTSFTKRYAAPEVVRQEVRGLPADIFSLGCVYMEIGTTAGSREENTVLMILNANPHGDTSFQANVHELQAHLKTLSTAWYIWTPIVKMLSSDPKARPTARDLVVYFGEHSCCTTGPDKLEVMEKDRLEEE